MAVNRYVDTSATYNGDGTSPEQATSDGGVGAYNDIQTALSNAPNNPSPGDEWHIWVRRLDSEISISSTLSPSNDGSYNAPHKLIGWPFRKQLTGQTVDSVPSGTDSLGFNNAQWQFVDSALTEEDNFWVGAEVEFTTGANSGLKRLVIWFDAAEDKIYLDFPLPNDIQAGDQYTITLETEEYDDRPQAGIDAGWDNDDNVTPIIDGGGGSFDLFNFADDNFWYLLNFEIKNSSTGNTYRAIYALPQIMKFTKIHDCGLPIFCSYRQTVGMQVNKLFIWNRTSSAYSMIRYATGAILENVHVNKGSGSDSTFIQGSTRLKNCTFGRVSSFTYSPFTDQYSAYKLEAENFMNGSSSLLSRSITGTYRGKIKIMISGYNGNPQKFIQAGKTGDVYNVEEGTIDPPSGATTFIKMIPIAGCSVDSPLEHEEQRYQSSGPKTYTWKFYPTGWSSLSTSDIEVEAWYLDESSGAHRAYTTANPSSVTNDTWNDLSITVNPAQAGTVYFKIKLKKYESTSAYIALDPKVDVS